MTVELVVVQEELEGPIDVQLTKKSVTVLEAVQLPLEELDFPNDKGSCVLGLGFSGGLLLAGGGPESLEHSPAM